MECLPANKVPHYGSEVLRLDAKIDYCDGLDAIEAHCRRPSERFEDVASMLAKAT